MRPVQSFTSWVVYRMSLRGKALGNAVCGQEEWEAMELARPGCQAVVHAGVTSEREAERLARGTSGDSFSSRSARKE